MEMITSAFLAKRVIEVTLGRMKELYAQLFFSRVANLTREQYNGLPFAFIGVQKGT